MNSCGSHIKTLSSWPNALANCLNPLRFWTRRLMLTTMPMKSCYKRMSILLQNKEHYLHRKEAAMQDKVPLIQQKKEILADMAAKESPTGHAWEPFRSGIRCVHCKLRYHSKSLLVELKEAGEKPCEKAPKLSQPKQTRMEMIHALVASQTGPQSGVHHLKLDRAYLRRTACKSYIGRMKIPSPSSSVSHATQDRWRVACGKDTSRTPCRDRAATWNAVDATQEPSSSTTRSS